MEKVKPVFPETPITRDDIRKKSGKEQRLANLSEKEAIRTNQILEEEKNKRREAAKSEKTGRPKGEQ